jgi:hypothetical protein
VNDTIQFHSTLPYLADPPPGYQQPAVDLLAGLAQIQRDINNGMFPNEHDFETALYRLLTAAHDDHLTATGGILSTFVYGAPWDIVSVSVDGTEPPKVYISGMTSRTACIAYHTLETTKLMYDTTFRR